MGGAVSSRDRDAAPAGAYGAGLTPEHAAMLAASGILPEVAAARGYRSIGTRADAERLGFGRSQRNVPALLVPV